MPTGHPDAERTHPKLHVRKPRFKLADLPRRWIPDSAFGTALGNAHMLLAPEVERFLVRTISHFMHAITEPALREQARTFIGQESAHRFAHEDLLRALERNGYEIRRFLWLFERCSRGLERLLPAQLRLAMAAASEHLSTVRADSFLRDDVRASLEDAVRQVETFHPAVRELVTWHAVEELEHKAVAYDVLQHVNPSYALRVAGFVAVFGFQTAFVILGAFAMLRQEELRELVAEFRSPPRSWKGQPRSAACQTISSYMRRDFHPLDVDHAGIVARYVAGPEAASWAGAVSRPI